MLRAVVGFFSAATVMSEIVIWIFAETIFPRLPLGGAQVVLDVPFFIEDFRSFSK